MSTSSNETASAEQTPEIQDAKFFAAVGYINVLCLVPLILKKNNAFAQFHGKQALVIFILELAAGILRVVPVLGEIVFTVSFVVLGLVSLFAMVKVLMGEKWRIPVVADVAERISF